MIKLQGINKQFADRLILKDVNLEIKRGEIFGLIGLSGAGKSTLLRIINQLEVQTSGTVDYEKEIKFGFVFQNFNLVNSLTVYDNVALSLINEQISKEEINKRVLDVLKLVGLEQLADIKPLKLSGGQRQRVGIARALVTDVNVLLCDEATSSLDPFTASEIINLLADLNSKLGITIVFVSHQLEIVRNFCDRIAIIDGGVVCECDDTINIFSKPKAEITWKLLKSILGLDNLVNIAQAGVITCHGEAETKQLINKLYGQEIEIHEINQHHTKQGKFTHLFVDIDSQTDESIRRVYEC